MIAYETTIHKRLNDVDVSKFIKSIFKIVFWSLDLTTLLQHNFDCPLPFRYEEVIHD